MAEFLPAVEGGGLQSILQAVDRTGVKCTYVLHNWDQIAYIREISEHRPRVLISLGREEDFTVYSFENFNRVAKELRSSLVAHIAEDRRSVEVTRKNFRRSTIQLLRDYGVLKSGTLLVHANHITRSEVAALEGLGLGVVLSVASAAAKRTGYPALKHLLAHNSHLCVGTDWGDVDVLNELRFISMLPVLFPHMPSISPASLIRMATINGAIALGLGDELGSIEPGKRADLICFSLDDIRVPWPAEDAGADQLAALVVAHLTSRDVKDVMVDGKFLVENGKILSCPETDSTAALRNLRKELLPRPAKSDRRGAEHPLKKGLVDPLPLVETEEHAEGFEEGFPVAGPHPVSSPPESPPPATKPAPTPPTPVKPKRDVRPGTLPELSKDVRREFGGDDDV